jgi:hypothetical protein
LSSKPGLGFSGDMRRMVVQDQLDRRAGWISGIDPLRGRGPIRLAGNPSRLKYDITNSLDRCPAWVCPQRFDIPVQKHHQRVPTDEPRPATLLHQGR